MGQRYLFSIGASDAVRTAPSPFSIASTLLLTYYWHETRTNEQPRSLPLSHPSLVYNTQLKFSWNIDRLKIPGYTLCALLFVAQVIVTGLYAGAFARSAAWVVDYLIPLFYLAVLVALTVFFSVTTIRIVTNLYRYSSSTPAQSSATHASEVSNDTPRTTSSDKTKQRAERKHLMWVRSNLFLVIHCITPEIVRRHYGCWGWLPRSSW